MRWAGSAISLIDQILSGGERSFLGAFESLRVRDVEVEPSALVNLNSPEDLEMWQSS
jgi:molybdopterin-guanine dinucleotide biosynthesis protein A